MTSLCSFLLLFFFKLATEKIYIRKTRYGSQSEFEASVVMCCPHKGSDYRTYLTLATPPSRHAGCSSGPSMCQDP